MCVYMYQCKDLCSVSATASALLISYALFWLFWLSAAGRVRLLQVSGPLHVPSTHQQGQVTLLVDLGGCRCTEHMTSAFPTTAPRLARVVQIRCCQPAPLLPPRCKRMLAIAGNECSHMVSCSPAPGPKQHFCLREPKDSKMLKPLKSPSRVVIQTGSGAHCRAEPSARSGRFLSGA